MRRVIVYSAVSDEPDPEDAPCIRFALRPVLDSEEWGDGPNFPCRVVGDWVATTAEEAVYASCRSVGCTFTADTAAGPWQIDGQARAWPSVGAALTWLLEGERPAQRRKKRGRR